MLPVEYCFTRNVFEASVNNISNGFAFAAGRVLERSARTIAALDMIKKFAV